MRINKAMVAELQQLGRDNQGESLTTAVVEKAKDTSSALNAWSGWKWDRREAAEAWWRHQARHLIGIYVEVVQEPNKAPIEIPGFISVKTNGDREDRSSLEVLAEDPNIIVNIVCDRCQSHLDKWPLLAQLDPIRKAILQVRTAANPPPKRRRGRPGKGEARVSV